MKLEVSVPELVEVFKEIQKQPEQIFEMIRLDVQRNCRRLYDGDDELGTHPFSGERALCT